MYIKNFIISRYMGAYIGVQESQYMRKIMQEYISKRKGNSQSDFHEMNI